MKFRFQVFLLFILCNLVKKELGLHCSVPVKPKTNFSTFRVCLKCVCKKNTFFLAC